MGGAGAAATAGAAAGYGATSAGGAGPYRKHHETGDSEELFANSSASPNSWGGVNNNDHATGQQQQQYLEKDEDLYGSSPNPYGGSTMAPAMTGAGVGAGMAAAAAAAHNNAWNASPSQQQEQPSHPLYPPAGNNASFLDSSANLLPGAGAAAAAPSPFSDAQAAREVGTGSEAPIAAAAAAGASPFGDSEGQGEVRIVVGTFDPKLDDELVLYVSRACAQESQHPSRGSDQVKRANQNILPLSVQPGDHIQVLMKYDDGWALGLNLSSGQHPPPKGCFPFDCLGQVVAPGTAAPPSSAANNNNNGGDAQLPMPVPVALQPGTPTFSVSPPSQTQSDLAADPASKSKPIPAPLQLDANPVVDPASVPLPPPTPSSTHATSPTSTSSSNEAPQLAPLVGLAAGSPLSADFPLAGGAAGNNSNQNKNVQGMKRASSLIASRDADLFVALGEVLDGQQQQQRPNEAGPSLI